MSKNKEIEQMAPKGQRINGKKASATRYIPFYEFLLFDPMYREMKDKAKILYAFLRKKSMDNEEKTQKYEEGEEGFTRSYRDENGEIYVIADNSELSIILQCHPNRVKDQKDELKRYGLLEEVPQLKAASYLYVLIPNEDQLTDKWTYIEEMKTLRAETQKVNKEKFKKYKENKESKKSSVDKGSVHNQQNVSYDNQQNVSYHNQQNVSKIYLKGFKSIPESLKPTLNLSIEETTLPIAIQITLKNQIDRLIEYNIKISDIEIHYHAVSEIYNESEYNFVLHDLFDEMKEKPRKFASVMNNWLERNRVNQSNVPDKNENGGKTPIRKEKEPYWLNKDDEHPEEKKDENSHMDREQFELEKKALFDRIKKYKDKKSG